MKRGVLIIFVAILIPCLLQAQTTPNDPQRLTLEQAVNFAVEHNKELQASQMNIELRNKMVTEAISQGLPQINGDLNYSTNFRYKMSFPGSESSTVLKDQSSVGVTVNQLLFSGEWILGIQTSKIAKLIASQQVDVTELDIKETVYNSYYTILVSERLMEIVKQNLENMSQIQRHTENMLAAGTAEPTDVDQIRITVGQLKNSLLAMQRTVDVNYNLLRLQLGLQAGTPITLADQLDNFLEVGNFLKLAGQEFDINQNAQYKLMETQEELQKKMVGLKKWAYSPTISANYGYTYKILKPSLDFSPKHSATITMSIPIFSGLQRKAQLDQEKITLEQTTLNKSLLADQLNLQEEQYKFALKNALEDYNLQSENIQVARKVLEKENIARTLDYTANLQADEQVYYAPAATGRIEKIYVEVGDRIKKGQLLVEMDRTNLQQAEVQLKNLETEYNRAKMLNETQSISKQAYDAAVTQYEVAKSNVDFLKENTRMLAPFNGVVTGKYFENGEVYTGAAFGGASKPSIIAIEKINPLKAYVNLSEQYFLSVKKGTKVELKSNLYPDRIFEGQVSIVYPTIDPASRTFTVEVKIPNDDEALRPGMYGTINFFIGNTETVVVPAIAVLKLQGANDRYVFINKDGKAKRVSVNLGKRFEDKIELISDEIQEGDELIVVGQGRVIDGSPITITQ